MIILLIKNCIYCIELLLTLISIVLLIYSIRNNNKYICKNIRMISIFYIGYLITNLCMISILYIPVGLEVLFIYLFSFIGIIIYIVSIILNSIKIKKIPRYEKIKKNLIITIILIIIPVLFVSANILNEKHLINNSDLIVVYHSSGNGGMGDSDTFAYAIGEDFCKQFDLGIDIGGYYLREFLPYNAVGITDMNDISVITDYEIVVNEDDSISVYKNNKIFCKINNKSHYFNLDFEKGFYIKK